MITYGLIFTNLHNAFLNSLLITGIPETTNVVECNERGIEVLAPHFPQFQYKLVNYIEYEAKIRELDPVNGYCITEDMYEKFVYFQKEWKLEFFKVAIPWISDISYSPLLILNKT